LCFLGVGAFGMAALLAAQIQGGAAALSCREGSK